jgi:hypothetical protein
MRLGHTSFTPPAKNAQEMGSRSLAYHTIQKQAFLKFVQVLEQGLRTYFLVRLETSWVRARNELIHDDCPLYLVPRRDELVPSLTKNTASALKA